MATRLHSVARGPLLPAVLILALSGGKPAEQNTVAGTTAPDGAFEEPVVLPLDTYMDVLPAIDVGVGDETMPFLFDTGGGLTIVTPSVVDRMGLTTFGRVTGFRMNGERVDLVRCESMSLKLGPVSIQTEPEVLDLMQRLPQGWPEVGGVVSLHTFRNHALTLDLASRQVILETEASMLRRAETMHPIPIRFHRQASGSSVDLLLEVVAKVGSLWLEVDTGNTGPVQLAPHALRQLGVNASTTGVTWTGTVDLNIAGLGPVDVAAAEADLICDGVLNIDTLQRMILSVDLPARHAWAALR